MHYVAGTGPVQPKLMIVGDCPTSEDVMNGKPFTGPAGREIEKLLREAGIDKNSCWLTNVIKYPVPMDNEKIPFGVRAERAGINIPTQLEELQKEINAVQPNCILGLGQTALWALTGKKKIQDYRGSILLGMGKKFIPSYHPGQLLWHSNPEFKGYWNRQIMLFDMKRACKQSEFPDLILPSRNLSVCRSSTQLQDFIKRHENATKLSIDIEAYHCIPACIGIAFNKREGLSVPLWNKFGLSNLSDSELVFIWILLSRLLLDARFRKIGQNFKYDQDKIRRLGFIIDKLYSDTMLKSFAINPELPVNLAFNTSLYTEEPFYKNEGMYEGSSEDLLIGNARDACVTYEIDEAMDADLDEIGQRPFYENFLMHLHDLYLGIEEEGFRLDPKAREELLQKYIVKDERINFDLFKLIGTPINTGSPKQVSELLYGRLGLPSRKGTGEEELTQLINSPKVKEEHKQIISLILEDRRVKKTISTYLMALPDFDGRMRTTYFLCLDTGRTSTGQQDPPIRPKIDIVGKGRKTDEKVLGMAFQTITKHGDIGGDIRRMFIPDDGEVFIQADKAQAEARVVFLLADDEQALKDIDEHDYHALTASWFFGGNESDYSKKVLGFESPIRFAGKTLRHAGHLGAGKKRAASELNTQARKYSIPITITEGQAEHALNVFHQKQPKIRSIFHASVIECISRTRVLIAPLPYGVDSPVGGRRMFFERWGDELNRKALSYLPQRAITDSTKADALRIKKRIPSIRILLEAHDGLLFSVPEKEVNEYVEVIQEEMQRPICFANCSIPRRDLIVPCDIEIGYNYKDLSKFKRIIDEKIGIASNT